ncbi:MAG: hypothetical protein HY053_08605 [Proteobacteria bacterium]|nr:hypothetical protein [Pseudomonadota bacterium]
MALANARMIGQVQATWPTYSVMRNERVRRILTTEGWRVDVPLAEGTSIKQGDNVAIEVRGSETAPVLKTLGDRVERLARDRLPQSLTTLQTGQLEYRPGGGDVFARRPSTMALLGARGGLGRVGPSRGLLTYGGQLAVR